jgi:hypothetical protein
MGYKTGLSDSQYYTNAVAIYDFWVQTAKLTPAQACGMLAQADAESSLNPTAYGDKDLKTNEYTAWGLYQIHTDRAEIIERATGVDLTTLPDVMDQHRAVWWELQNVKLEENALEKVRACTTAVEAGAAACKYYERAGAPGQAAKRAARAEEWYEWLTKKPGLRWRPPTEHHHAAAHKHKHK